MSDSPHRNIMDVALDYQKKASAHISNYYVGAALGFFKSDDEDPYVIYGGCNVEFDIHSTTIHAEQMATANAWIAHANHEGDKAELVVKVDGPPFYPCGLCRQILYEKWGYGLIVHAIGSDVSKSATLEQLLPEGFRLD